MLFRIGHDNKGGGGAWFLDKVAIDAPSLGKTWLFPCGHWLSDSDEDRLLERELYPQELATEEYTPCEFMKRRNYITTSTRNLFLCVSADIKIDKNSFEMSVSF